MSRWREVGQFLKGSLPILGTALGGPAGGAIGALVSSALGTDATPEAALAKLQQDPEAILKYKLAELESNKDVLVASLNAQQQMLETVNQTIRNEHNSDDPFVRRWRPFYGYAVATSWAVQMLGFTFMFVYVAITAPEKLTALVGQFAILSGSLISLWGIALAILGVSVHKRSQDKQTNLETQSKGILAKLMGK